MKRSILYIYLTLAVLLISTGAANAQIASGGSYTLNQSVIGGGGGTSSDTTNNVYKIEGTIGEPVAGTTSSNAPYSVRGGFFAANALAPTAAPISISGRVITASGSGLRNARVTLIDQRGAARTILSGKLGTFRFDEVLAGETYIISISSRHYTFAPQVVTANEEITNLNFSGVAQSGGEFLDNR